MRPVEVLGKDVAATKLGSGGRKVSSMRGDDQLDALCMGS